MTWSEAEAIYPGCSAHWDITCQTAKGIWTIDRIYQQGRWLLVRVTSTEGEFITGSGYLASVGRFQYSILNDGRWLLC